MDIVKGGSFVAFRYRDFRLLWGSSLLSSSGTWLQNVAVPIVVFNITGSGVWLGITGFVGYAPMVFTGPYAGWIADRFDRRRVLILGAIGQAIFTFAICAYWASGDKRIGIFISLLAANSFVAGLTVATWQAFVTEMVPREHLLNAITLNSAQFNAARAFGPSLGGLLLVPLGEGWLFFLNGMTFVVLVFTLLLIRTHRKPPPPPPGKATPIADMVDACRYAFAEPGIAVCLIVVFFLGFLGGPLFNLIVVFTERVWDVGGSAYGLLAGCLGFGAIVVAPFVAGRGSRTNRSVMLTIAMVSYGLALVGVGASPIVLTGAIALLVAGAGYLGISSTLNTTVQLQVSESMRGKVLALYVVVLTAAVPLGSLLQGWLVDVIGVQWTVAGAGVIMLIVFGVLRSLGRFEAMNDLTRGEFTEATEEDAEIAIAEAEATEAAIDPI